MAGRAARGRAVNVPAGQRLLAAAEYLGLAAFTHRQRGAAADNDFVAGHHRHALALMLGFLGVIVLYVVGIAFVTVAIMNNRALYEEYHLESHVLSALRKVFLAWAVFWCFALVTAMLGREAYLPGLWRIVHRPRLMRGTARVWLGLFILLGVTFCFAAYATTKVRQDDAPAKVHLLYENAGRFPRWLFAIGFYPMANAAERRFGPGQVILQRVTRESLHRSLHEASFVFLGTHGMHQGILVPDGFFKVSDVTPGEVNQDLKFVYMAGCDQGAGWETAFAPAKVISYNRLTSVAEHVWWMWFDGPRAVRELP